MAALLAGLDEPNRFKSALYLSEWQRLKPPQSQPRQYELMAIEWRLARRSEVPTPPSGWRVPLPRFRLDWRCPLRCTGRRTSDLHAKLSQRTGASYSYPFTLLHRMAGIL